LRPCSAGSDVDAVEITYEALDARVRGIIQQVPVELPIVIPFALLRDPCPDVPT